MASVALRDGNREPSVVLSNTLFTAPVIQTGVVLASSTPAHVAIVDGTGTQITSFGGGTQYADGDARGTATGTLMMVDDGANIQSALGDTSGRQFVNISQINAITPLMGNGTTGTGSLRVTIASDNTAFSVDTELPAAAALSDSFSNPTSPAVGAFGMLWNSNAATWERQVAIRSGLNVGGGGITAAGLMAQFDDVSPTTITENQFGNVRMSNNRNVYTTIRDAAGNERGLNIDASGQIAITLAAAQTLATVTTLTGTTTLTPGTAATNLGKAEDAAHTTGDVGVFALGVRNDTLATITNTDADYSQMSTDLKGRVMVGSAPRTLKANQITTITTSTAETTIVTQVASTFLDLYGLIVTNTSGSAVTVAIKDSTAGTTRFNIAVPAGDTRGFMLDIDAAIKQTTVNNNWTATTQSVTSVIITALTVANL